jgi:hypothetical protein
METAINRNPFYKDGVDILHLHVTFINEETKKENQQKTESCYYEPDKFEIKKEMYSFIARENITNPN